MTNSLFTKIRILIKTPVFFLLVILIVLYLLTLKGLPGNLHPNGSGSNAILPLQSPFETSQERGRYAQTISIVESGNFDVNEFYTFLIPDLAWYNGKYLAAFPVGTSVVAAPFYFVGKMVGLSQVFTFMISVLFNILSAYIIFKTCIKLNLSSQTGILAAIIFSLCSVAWPYGVSFSAHPFSAFIIALGFFAFVKIFTTGNKIPYYLLLGLLLSLCLLVDYPDFVIFLPIVLGALLPKMVKLEKINKNTIIEFNPKYVLTTLASFSVGFTLFVLFNLYYYQKPIAFTNIYNLKFLESTGVNLKSTKLSNELFNNINYATRFSFSRSLSGINTLLISKDRGLFLYSPIFLLTIPGFILFFRKKRLFSLVILLSFLLALLIYGSYDDPWGGWSFGPRYLIVVLPLLAVLCGFAFEFLVQKFGLGAKIVIFGLLLFSSAIALLGALTTNAVPPSIEVVNTNIPSNYISNWNYLTVKGVSSFIYYVLFSKVESPQLYALGILLMVAIVEFVVIFKRISDNS